MFCLLALFVLLLSEWLDIELSGWFDWPCSWLLKSKSLLVVLLNGNVRGDGEDDNESYVVNLRRRWVDELEYWLSFSFWYDWYMRISLLELLLLLLPFNAVARLDVDADFSSKFWLLIKLELLRMFRSWLFDELFTVAVPLFMLMLLWCWKLPKLLDESSTDVDGWCDKPDEWLFVLLLLLLVLILLFCIKKINLFKKKKDLERIENHIKKLDYLYKDPNNANIYSNYLLEKVNSEKK